MIQDTKKWQPETKDGCRLSASGSSGTMRPMVQERIPAAVGQRGLRFLDGHNLTDADAPGEIRQMF